MSLRREQLLGYLLGALEPEEQAEVERELAAHERLRQELAEIRAVLDNVGLTDRPEPLEPPAGLVDRTCELVAAQGGEIAPVGLPPDRSPAGSVSTYSLTDVLAAASVLLVLSALVFPSLARSRFMARLAACENNLRQVGWALIQDSEMRPDRRYALLPWGNPRTVAGMMAPVLIERQALANRQAIICPTSPMANLPLDASPPTCEQVLTANGDELKYKQHIVGGSLAWPVPFTADGELVPPRNQYREYYCLVAEAPIVAADGRVLPGHEGLGTVLCFEDGHVKFLRGVTYRSLPDHPYLNRRQQADFGMDGDDSVLGRSEMRPNIVPVKLQP